MDNAAQNNERIATDKRIPHSRLIQYLVDSGASQLVVKTVCDMTRYGVYPEAADLAARNQSIISESLTNLKAKSESKPVWPDTVDSSGFQFGRKSVAELAGCHPLIVEFAAKTLTYSRVDFMVYDGLRTKIEQAKLVQQGMSKTMQSMHLPQKDGFSHAVDLVPVINGVPKWDWDQIYFIACAADRAAHELGIAERITWGGAWDRRLSDFGGDTNAFRKVVMEYCDRHPGKDFIDGPHWQLES